MSASVGPPSTDTVPSGGVLRLNIGCGRLRIPGYLGVDYRASPSVDVVTDIGVDRWPFQDGTVDSVVAWHVLEHLPGREFYHAMAEIHRVVKPGGMVYVKVPYRDEKDYNPHHCRSFGRHSFDAWLDVVPADVDGSLEAEHGWFHRIAQKVVHLPGGFPSWHIHRFLSGHPTIYSCFYQRDERAAWSRLPPVFGGPFRELREWWVRL